MKSAVGTRPHARAVEGTDQHPRAPHETDLNLGSQRRAPCRTRLAPRPLAWAQSALTATTAAVIMTLEPVFAGVLAFALGESSLGWVGWAGGILIVGGMAVAELRPRQCCDALAPRVECC